MEMDCRDGFDRVEKLDYECSENGCLTTDAIKKFNKDCDLLKNHMGYDPRESDPRKRNSEFKCDRPFFDFSIDNILYEISDDKGKKHSSGDTDLFLFVTEEEFKILFKMLDQELNDRYQYKFYGFYNVNIYLSTFSRTHDFSSPQL